MHKHMCMYDYRRESRTREVPSKNIFIVEGKNIDYVTTSRCYKPEKIGWCILIRTIRKWNICTKSSSSNSIVFDPPSDTTTSCRHERFRRYLYYHQQVLWDLWHERLERDDSLARLQVCARICRTIIWRFYRNWVWTERDFKLIPCRILPIQISHKKRIQLYISVMNIINILVIMSKRCEDTSSTNRHGMKQPAI